MKKTKIFKKFILPTSVLSGLSTTFILASCQSNVQVTSADVEKFIQNNYSIGLNAQAKSAFDVTENDLQVTNSTKEKNLSFKVTLLNNIQSLAHGGVNGMTFQQILTKMLAGEVLVKVDATFKNYQNNVTFSQYQFVPGALSYENALTKISDTLPMEEPKLNVSILPLTKNLSNLNHNLVQTKYDFSSVNLKVDDHTKWIIEENNILTGVVKLQLVRYFSENSKDYLFKKLNKQITLHLEKYLPDLDLLLNSPNWKTSLNVDLSKINRFKDTDLSTLNPSQLTLEEFKSALSLNDLINVQTNEIVQLPDFYKKTAITNVEFVNVNDLNGTIEAQVKLNLPFLENSLYVSKEGVVKYVPQTLTAKIVAGGFKNNITKEQKPTKPTSIFKDSKNVTNEISSSNMLDMMQDKLNLTSSSKFFIFPKDVDVTQIKTRDFLQNNYIGQYVNFNKQNLKNLLKNQFPNANNLIKNLDFEIRYHDIHQNIDNPNQIILPIDVKHYVNPEKFLYEYRTINFVIDNLGSNTFIPKFIKLTKDLDNLMELIKQNKVVIESSNSLQVASVLQDYSLEELSVEQLNKLFKVKISSAVADAINKLWDDNHIVAKIFVDKVNFDGPLNNTKLSIRVALSDNSDEVDKLIKAAQKEKPDFVPTKTQLLKSLNNFSQINLGKNFNVNFNYQNTPLETFLRNAQLASLVQVNIKNATVANYNFEKMKIDDFTFYKPIQLQALQLVGFKVVNAKNVDFTFKAIDSVNQKEYTFIKHFGLGRYANVFEKSFTESNENTFNFITGPLTKENLSRVNASIFNLYGTDILSGGYDELRGFYADSPVYPYQIHLGEDYLAPKKTPIIAPYDGEILGIVYHRNADKTKDTAEGIGTTLQMRVKVEDLHLTPKDKELYFKDSEYAYIGIIHLDQEFTFKNQALGISSAELQQSKGKNTTIDTYATVLDHETNQQVPITPEHPLKVKKGQIIAYVGDTHENGGWMTHAHFALVASGTKSWNANGFWKTKSDYYGARLKSYNPADPAKHNWGGIRVNGVFFSQSDFSRQANPVSPKIDKKTGKLVQPKANGVGNYSFPILPITDREMIWGLRNPNILFKVRTKETYTFDINALFKLQQQNK
ncbi:Uncharacterised protein [Mycoplasmopsis citelli]|uniref:Lipoprotein n=1 Tax=Mycoplasmopsis citelli TaxID=171281 RepID=A0A449B160_9BACT|nr:hypothetical protein [Mycoplasmopsis citelli]VEU74340.1 Uncharacterised protein [Mycoplasmopsis citelli]